jgi:hypothetical protein
VKRAKRAVRRRVAQFEADLDRAVALFGTLVLNGMSNAAGGVPTPLRQPDRRDAAQFIFFEIAAKFEALMQDLFVIAIRKKYSVSPSRAEFIMGSPDRGLGGILGWGSVETIQKRARNLFGKVGFLPQLKGVIDEPAFSRLGLAHTLRNRVAHDTPDAREKYRKALATLGVPKRSRQGAGVGRVLIEYPAGAQAGDRWFHRFLRAYRRVATKARDRL